MSRKLEIAIIVVVVIVAIIAGLAAYSWWSSYQASSSYYPSYYTTTYTTQALQALNVLLPSGYVLSLSPGDYYSVEFTTPSYATDIFINGSYVSNHNVEVLILTPVEFGAFTQNPGGVINSGDYVWYSGDNAGATIYTTLAPGQTYYLVFYDGNIISSDTITVQASITVWGYTTGG